MENLIMFLGGGLFAAAASLFIYGIVAMGVSALRNAK